MERKFFEKPKRMDVGSDANEDEKRISLGKVNLEYFLDIVRRSDLLIDKGRA